MEKKLATHGEAEKGTSKKPKKPRLRPAAVYGKSLPEIAAALAEEAKKGSYLHARALKELAESEEVKRKRKKERAKHERMAQAVMDRLR